MRRSSSDVERTFSIDTVDTDHRSIVLDERENRGPSRQRATHGGGKDIDMKRFVVVFRRWEFHAEEIEHRIFAVE